MAEQKKDAGKAAAAEAAKPDQHMVGVRKASGGSMIIGPDGTEYEWKNDGSTLQVPYEFAMELVHIQDGGYTVVSEKAAQKAGDAVAAEEAAQAPEEEPGEEVAAVAATPPGPVAAVSGTEHTELAPSGGEGTEGTATGKKK
jgi:hypothetical protein